MNGDICERCGLDHGRLNVELTDDGTLHRRLDSSRGHFLRIAGGAIGYRATLISAHLGELARLVCEDTFTGTVYHVSIWDFQRYSFKTDLGAGEQSILALRYWKQLDTWTGPGEGAQLADVAQETDRAQIGEQLRFEMPSAAPTFFFKKGTGPRPRRTPHRR